MTGFGDNTDELICCLGITFGAGGGGAFGLKMDVRTNKPLVLRHLCVPGGDEEPVGGEDGGGGGAKDRSDSQ